MKKHIFIALGILLAMIFMIRAFDAIRSPHSLWQSLYICGGFILSGLLIYRGIKDFR